MLFVRAVPLAHAGTYWRVKEQEKPMGLVIESCHRGAEIVLIGLLSKRKIAHTITS